MTYMHNFLTVGITSMCVVVLSMDLNNENTKLSDGKKCPHLCNNMHVFPSFPSDFKVTGLTCQVAVIQRGGRGGEERRYIAKKCEGWFRRQNPQENTEPKQVPFTRILVLPVFRRDKRVFQAKQIYLRDNAVRDYPYLKIAKLTAAAYIYSKRIIVVATRFPSKITFYPLNSNIKHVVKQKGAEISSIAVDEMNQNCFLTSAFPKNKLFSMTMEGKDYKLVTVLKCSPQNIAVDPKRSVIFIACRHKCVAKHSYAGDFIKNVIEEAIGRPLWLDSKRDVLYFMLNKGKSASIHQMKLTDSTSSKMPGLGFKVSDFILVDNKFYMCPSPFKGAVMVQSSNNHTLVEIPVGEDSFRVILCGIP